MSTKMSTDLNLTRPSSRVSRPPGGASSNIFGTDAAPPAPRASAVQNSPPMSVKKSLMSNSPVKPPAPPAVEHTAAAVEIAPVVKKVAAPVAGKVGVVVAGPVESEFLLSAIAKALVVEGISGTVVAKVGDVAALPYAAQNVARNVDVVVAATIVANDINGTVSQSLSSTLLQAGVSGRSPIIPAIVSQPSLLEAKAMVPHLAATWAQSVVTILGLQFGGSIELEAAPEVVLPVHHEYTASEENFDVLLDLFRESLKSRGARGIAGLSRKFKIADDNGNGQIDFKEFAKVIAEHGFNWTPTQVKKLFEHFDSDKSGSISFDEFLFAIRGQLNERRKALVLTAFAILDSDKSGVVEVNDIREKYDASKHPDVKAGKRTADEVLSEFLDTFDSIDKDGKVTAAEFIKYYGNVSSSIDEDDYFELMIRNAWHISGGEGWCANSSNRRVLVTHQDGHQTVEEIKNDLGIKDDDFDKMLENLKAQGISDVIDIELSSGVKSSGPKKTEAVAAAPVADARPATATNYGRRAPGGKTTLVLG